MFVLPVSMLWPKQQLYPERSRHLLKKKKILPLQSLCVQNYCFRRFEYANLWCSYCLCQCYDQNRSCTLIGVAIYWRRRKFYRYKVFAGVNQTYLALHRKNFCLLKRWLYMSDWPGKQPMFFSHDTTPNTLFNYCLLYTSPSPRDA